MSTTNITRAEAARRTETLRVEAYRTTVDLRRAADDATSSCPVHCVVELDSTATETFLDFLDGSVQRLVVNGAEQEVHYDGARIPLALRVGRNVVELDVEATYSRSGQGLHRFVDPLDGNTYLYTQYEPADARRLFPNFDQPDLKAVHHVTVLAPEGWQVRSNQPCVASEPVEATEALPAAVRHSFGPTPLLSTYLTCIIAGPWYEQRGEWTAPGGQRIELGLLCRQSLAQYLDADAILDVTRRGLGFYGREFGHPYPWGKYDQVFVPEYNLGAMENPGLVTFTEAYLPRSAATRTEYQGRANTILHEMAHMWFGDLVTPAWWDDLWLKESFAEFMGAHASVEATEFTDAWVAFAGRRKAWAYRQDQLPTTHPIVADIADVEAAKQNFDGITYAKGAAVLKQLVAHVGLDAFMAGSRAYFDAHAFSSARLDDLLNALQQASGRDLQAWSRAWLQTAGPDLLEPVVECRDARITRLAVRRTSVDARDGSPVGRPHTLRVGLWQLEGDRLVRSNLLDVELPGSGAGAVEATTLTEVGQAAGLPEPAMVLVNDGDLTYARVGFDAASLAVVLEHLQGIDDPLARAVCWSSLWGMVRDAELTVARYLAAVEGHGLGEPDVSTLADLLGNARVAISAYLPDGARAAAAESHATALLQALRGAEAGSDRQLALARAFGHLAAQVPSVGAEVEALLAGDEVVDGLELGPDLRWVLVHALLATGRRGAEVADAELAADSSATGVTARLAALAARPDATVKADAWQQLHQPRALVNDHVDALVQGVTEPGQEHLVAGLARSYFDGLEQVWAQHSIEIAQRLVVGLFPTTDDAPELAQAWLDAHAHAPAALRRLVLEGQDGARRSRRAREFNA